MVNVGDRRCAVCDGPLPLTPHNGHANYRYCSPECRGTPETVRRRCTVPGCDQRAQARGLCCVHQPRREIPGYRDVYCQICGLGPRSSLAKHVIKEHEGCADYKRRFGWDSLTSVDLRFNHKAVWDDMVEDGRLSIQRRQKTCKNGHRLTKSNVYLYRHGGSGPDSGQIDRHCRKCTIARSKRYYKKVKQRRRKCKLKECREWFMPWSSKQVYCSGACRSRAWLLNQQLKP